MLYYTHTVKKTRRKGWLRMALVREDGRLVDCGIINSEYNGRSVLLVYNGKKLPVGNGYIVYSSDATTREDALADQIELGDLLVKEYKSDGILSSGWGGIADLCTL
jgi:hypothetical protein